MPHIPQRFRSIKTEMKDGTAVPPPPSASAPLTSQDIQPDLMDVLDDLPVIGEAPGRKRSKVPNKKAEPNKNPMMGTLNIRGFDVSPGDIEAQMTGG